MNLLNKIIFAASIAVLSGCSTTQESNAENDTIVPLFPYTESMDRKKVNNTKKAPFLTAVLLKPQNIFIVPVLILVVLKYL